MKIRRITLFLRIKDLKLTTYDIAKYVLILIYISVIKKDDIKVLYRIHREIYFVNNLKTYMLLSNNVIDLEKIILDIA